MRRRWILAFSISLNLFLAFMLVRQINLHEGGGQHLGSPDRALLAMAQSRTSMNPLASDRRHTYYLLWIERKDGTRPWTVRLDEEPDRGLYFRSLPQIISWSDDSSEATFRFPGDVCTLKVD